MCGTPSLSRSTCTGCVTSAAMVPDVCGSGRQKNQRKIPMAANTANRDNDIYGNNNPAH